MSVSDVGEERAPVCEDCEGPLDYESVCNGCCEVREKAAEERAKDEAYNEGYDDAEEELTADEDVIAAEAIRRWAQSRKLLGRITPEVAAALERCADDIEAGE
ncbi:MAG TPA: hypothetical protein VI384_04355 [Candidatus Dormibacteraeota bacterium]